MKEPILSIQNVSKTFPGTKALSDVSVDIYPGTVHVLIGENGAGKSTLMKMMAGIYSIEEGQIFYQGTPLHYTSPRQALDDGIVMIPQELSVMPDLTVAENIFTGHEFTKSVFIDRAKTRQMTKQILDSLHMEIDPDTVVSKLSTAQMQMVEIARAISRDARVLIMDEPTATLSDKEVQMLFSTIRQLKERGIAIIYISHRLEELFVVGDTVTVLRDGCLVKTMPIGETDVDHLVTMMVGREVTDYYNKSKHLTSKVVLKAEHFSHKGEYEDISFELYEGEILGISGLVGAGRSELLMGLLGANKRDSGDLYLNGELVHFRSPKEAIRAGIGIIPEERKTQGIIVEDDIKSNVSLPSLENITHRGFISRSWEVEHAQEYVEKLRIKTPSITTLVKSLSGGNQQKVVIAKWLARETNVLFVDEVTRGVDVNAKAEIYLLLNQFTEKGGSVLMVSSELPELLGVCDRILVMREGKLSGELSREEATEEKIMQLANL